MKAERKRFYWGDAAVYAALILLIAGLFLAPWLMNRNDRPLLAEIALDGEVIETVELFSLGDETLRRSVHGCEIELDCDGARIVSANCPDQICVHTGAIRSAGEAIACVPNRVTVTLRQSRSGTDYDVVAY